MKPEIKKILINIRGLRTDNTELADAIKSAVEFGFNPCFETMKKSKNKINCIVENIESTNPNTLNKTSKRYYNYQVANQLISLYGRLYCLNMMVINGSQSFSNSITLVNLMITFQKTVNKNWRDELINYLKEDKVLISQMKEDGSMLSDQEINEWINDTLIFMNKNKIRKEINKIVINKANGKTKIIKMEDVNSIGL